MDARKSLTEHSIVLDLDETLVRTLSVNESEEAAYKIADTMGIYTNIKYIDIRMRSFRLILDDPVTPKGAGRSHGCWGITRPHLKEFLTFCFAYFKTVNVWSAGVDDYVRKIAKTIPGVSGKFNVVYTRNDCEVLPENKEFYKPLSKMIKNDPIVGPLEHLFVLDDREMTFSSNPGNGIVIPIYKPSPTESSLRMDDDHLMRLKYWLLQPEVMNCEDITKLDKRGIFQKSVAEYISERKQRMKENYTGV